MSRRKFKFTTVGLLAGVLLLAIATSPLWTILLVKQRAAQIVSDSLLGLTSASLANIDISDGFMELAVAIAAKDASARTQTFTQIDATTKQTDLQLKEYEGSVLAPAERRIFDQLMERRTKYRQTRAQVVAFLQQGNDEAALQLYREKALPEFMSYKEAINTVVHYNVEEARARGIEIIRLCHYLLILQGVLLVFFFIYAFFVPMLTIFEHVITREDQVRDI